MKFLLLALLVVALVAAFLCLDGAATHPFTPEPGILGKPNAAVGWLAVTVVDRPSMDRAWIRAQWTRGTRGANCRLLFIAPDGATVLEGAEEIVLDPEAQTGDVQWLVDFPTDRDLDAVIRLCADTERGTFACEAYAILGRRAPK